MSRIEISQEEDDEIWEYRSQTKKLRLTQNSQCSSLKTERDLKQNIKSRNRITSRKDSNVDKKSLPLHDASNSWTQKDTKESYDDFKPSMTGSSIIKKESNLSQACNIKDDPDKKHGKKKPKTRQRKTRKTSTVTGQSTPNDKIRSGRCRVCQFPFMALSRVDTPSWHEEVCLGVPCSSKEQCPSGINCTSTIESHYKKYKHTALSRSEHKHRQERPFPLSVDIHNAKMKLEFDDNQLGSLPSPTDDCVIDLNDSPDVTENFADHGVTNVSSHSDSAALKRKSDQLKKGSVLTLIKQNENNTSRTMRQSCTKSTFISQPALTSQTRKISKSRSENCLDPVSKIECGDGMTNGLYDVKKERNSVGVDQDSEEVLTRVEFVDLVHSGSANSVGDIDDITDDSRSVPDMLKDVFGEDDSGNTDHRKQDLPVTFTGILEYESLSDDDTDILNTSLSMTKSSLQRQTTNKGSNFGKASEEISAPDQTHTNCVKNKDTFLKTNCVVSEHLSTGNVTPSNTVVESLTDNNSSSKDSAKGFFARKLAEKKVSGGFNKKDIFDATLKSGTSQTIFKEDVIKQTNAKDELCTNDSADKSNIGTTEELLCEKGIPVNDKDMSSMNDKDTNNKSIEITKDIHKIQKKKLKMKKKHQYKSSFQKEIERMDMAGLGKITMETDSSEDECFQTGNIPKHRYEMTHHGCRVPISINLIENCRNTAKSDGLINSKCRDSVFTLDGPEITQSNHIPDTVYSIADLNQGKTDNAQASSSQMSLKMSGSTPKFQIENIRTIGDGLEEELELSGGFFRGEPADMFSEKTKDFTDKDNFSECDEDIYDDCELHQNLTSESSSDKGKVGLAAKPTFPLSDEDLDVKLEHTEAPNPMEVIEKVAEKVQQIQKNALDILMQTSRALQNGGKSVIKSGIKSVVSNSNRSVNDVLMSKENKNLPTVNPTKPKMTPKATHDDTEENEPATSGAAYNNNRNCPFYKKIPGTNLTVDAFKYGNIPDCKAYILSHFHYDHYGGLKKSFTNPLYCSKITGNLVMKKIGVKPQYIHTVPLNVPTIVDGVEITFLEANHCPGAVLILFKLKGGRVFLHTGDFRACTDMESYPELQSTRIHSLYLDTTYCDPQYDFPSQKEAVNCAIKLAREAVRTNPSTLIVCGCYTIGKERIFKGIMEDLDCKVCVTRDKKSVIDCLEDEWLQKRTSLVWNDAQLHVLPMAKLNYQGLKEHLEKNGKKYTAILGIKPTGWTYNKKLVSMDHIKPEVNKDSIKVYGLPYSEHSSFLEMKRFVQFTKPDKILPTVNNGNYHSRKKMEVIFEAWMEESRRGSTVCNIQPSVKNWTS